MKRKVPCEHKMACCPSGWDMCLKCGSYGECPEFYGGACEFPDTKLNPGDPLPNPAAVALGSIKSDKKAAAARINGLKGGRPRTKKLNAKQQTVCKLELQVVSLELAQKLKELGVKQESYFNWNIWDEQIPVVQKFGNYGGMDKDMTPYLFSAFTVAELGEMLPKEYQIYSYPTRVNNLPQWDCTSGDTRLMTEEGWEEGHRGTPPMFSETEADARAKMLVYLLENNLISPSPKPAAQQ